MMRQSITLAAASCLLWVVVGAGERFAQEPIPVKPVAPPVIWRATGEQLAATRGKCPLKWMQTLVDCFVEAMESQGAPPQAIALVKVLGKDERYLTNLREIGLVNVAAIQRPDVPPTLLMASSPVGSISSVTRGPALVNGNPPVIPVNAPEVLQWIGQDGMARGLLPENPELAIHPGVLFVRNLPIAHEAAGGGQEFTVGYTASTGCAWCDASTIFARFRFDDDGNFLGVSIQNVARDEDTEIPEPDPDNGDLRRKVLRQKVGDVIQFKMRCSGDTWRIVTSIDASVLREVDHGGFGFCAGVCVGEENWLFEAIGPGETHLVFRTFPQNGQFSPPEMTVEYVIQVK